MNRMLGMRAVATRLAKSQRKCCKLLKYFPLTAMLSGSCLSTATKLSGVDLISRKFTIGAL